LIKINKLNISIVLIWLFTISGIIGILSPVYSSWFLKLTPLNLSVMFGLFLWNLKEINNQTFIALSIPFFLGFITEFLGVNYGFIFGDYTYGENLGVKIWGVPIIICINWALLTAITSKLSTHYFKNRLLAPLVGAFLMTLLDAIIEVSAPKFDFWEFEGGIVPLQNYVGWFFIALISHIGYQYFNVQASLKITWHIWCSMFLFFTFFLFF